MSLSLSFVLLLPVAATLQREALLYVNFRLTAWCVLAICVCICCGLCLRATCVACAVSSLTSTALKAAQCRLTSAFRVLCRSLLSRTLHTLKWPPTVVFRTAKSLASMALSRIDGLDHRLHTNCLALDLFETEHSLIIIILLFQMAATAHVARMAAHGSAIMPLSSRWL